MVTVEALLLAAQSFILLGYMILEGRAHRRLVNRLVDAALSGDASQFRIRQTTRPAEKPSDPAPRSAHPNQAERPAIPLPIGL